MDTRNWEFFGQKEIFDRLNIVIDPRDSMFHGNMQYYFECGASGIAAIRRSLESANISESSVMNILDYGCGYGRVLRWLSAGFENADILAIDTDEKALVSANKNFGVKTKPADINFKNDLDQKFDFIWIGSLFTHLPQVELLRLLDYLIRQLSDAGVLIFSTHGPYVVERIRCGEKCYGLERDGIKRLLLQYDLSSFGFSPYPQQQNYGITIINPIWMMGTLEHAGLDTVLYDKMGWIKHQDVFASKRNNRSRKFENF